VTSLTNAAAKECVIRPQEQNNLLVFVSATTHHTYTKEILSNKEHFIGYKNCSYVSIL
jgi:hypothetical protein